MLTMDRIHDIRLRFFTKGEKVSRIARDLQLDRRTVQKYIDMTDFNAQPSKPAEDLRICPKLDPYKATIEQWLIDDKQAPRKQRPTAPPP